MNPHLFDRPISRRALLRGALASSAGAGAIAVFGCGSSTKRAQPTTGPSMTASVAPSTSPTPVATAAPAVWSQVSAAAGPTARRDHSLTFNAADGLLYAFGGRAAGIPNNELWSFDPGGSGWRQVTAASGPEARFGHNAYFDAAARRLVVALGQGEGAFFNDVWSFADGAWRRLDDGSGDGPEIRYGSGSAYDARGNRLIITHGFTDRGRFDDTWAFDLAAGRWSKLSTQGDVPIKRCLTRAIWLDASQSIAMFGGQTDDNPFLGDFWTLDLGRGRWTERTIDRPSARNLYGADRDARTDRWYVVSGNTPDGPVAETWTYDLASSTWQQPAVAGAPPPPRYSADAAIAGSALYLFAGHDGQREIADFWSLALPA